MTNALCTFFTGLIPSLIGAVVGVLIGLWVDRWREQRSIRREAYSARQEIINEIDNHMNIIQGLIAALERMQKQAETRLLSSSDFAKPFARLQTMRLRLALERRLVRHMWKKHVIAVIATGMYLEDCEAINIRLNQFENYVNSLLLPLPDPSDETLWRLTVEDLSPRISDLVSYLKDSLNRTSKTYNDFRTATGLR